jgi:hypothetical protein
MKKYSGRAADPVDGKFLVPFHGSQLAAANTLVWSLAVRWGSTIHTGTAAAPAFDGWQLAAPEPRAAS